MPEVDILGMSELPKAYEPQQYEDGIYQKWEKSGFFNPDVCVEKGVTKTDAKPFTIILPPPNATGMLHAGHAMMLAIEDLMIRYHRMKGDRTLWLPGTDHAAIATNAIVEKQLAKEGKTKDDLGREQFIARVKDFIKQSQDNIRHQVRKMGSSLDWSREAYTWDEQRNLAVRTMFKKMYDDELIYRGYRIVNWCPHCHSTLADDEVEYKEQKAKLYTFKYSPDFPFSISTTRPETKLGDTAVAVNPKDKRYKKYIGKILEVKKFAGGPDLKLKIFGDESVDMDFGTGAVGVTPAHSFADYNMYFKHKLEFVPIIDEDGKMTEKAGKEYVGLNVLEARNKVIGNLINNGSIDVNETMPSFQNNLSICYRCGTAIEPLPSKQWFIDVNKEFAFHASKEHPIKGLKDGQKVTLKKLMQQVVRIGQIEIIPERFDKIYFHWIDNLRDWCISRQIWIGHQIPVWYKKEAIISPSFQEGVGGVADDAEIYVGVEAPQGAGWVQDSDVLDTWFSSGLWTFSTLGWPGFAKATPDKPTDLQIYHPTSVLETGHDILFFWVARMIMMTTYALGEIPFEKVYLHARVLDKDGEKMSKSKPQTMIDPLVVCEKYGTDAMRLALLIGVTPGTDIRLSEEKIAGFRNFTNKLWNIARYINTVIPSTGSGQAPAGIQTLDSRFRGNDKMTLADKWILSRLNQITAEITKAIDDFQFSLAGEKLRDFTWGDLADWYLEIAKIEGSKSEILNYILNTILKLWHPFMPFVTEQIWSGFAKATPDKTEMLMVTKWPSFLPLTKGEVEGVADDFGLIQSIIAGIRSVRADKKIEPAKKINVVISAGKKAELLEENREIIEGLARLESLAIAPKAEKPANSVGFVERGVEVFIDLTGVIDATKEKVRLEAEIEALGAYIEAQKRKLANPEFAQKAPPAIIEKERAKLKEAEEKLEKIKSQQE